MADDPKAMTPKQAVLAFLAYARASDVELMANDRAGGYLSVVDSGAYVDAWLDSLAAPPAQPKAARPGDTGPIYAAFQELGWGFHGASRNPGILDTYYAWASGPDSIMVSANGAPHEAAATLTLVQKMKKHVSENQVAHLEQVVRACYPWAKEQG